MTVESDERILLLGVDKYLLRACSRTGARAVVVQSTVGLDEGLTSIPTGFDRIRVDNMTDVEAILAGLHRAGLAGEPFAAVLTSIEQALVTTAILSTHLGCRGIDPTTALLHRDKDLQKRRIRSAGLDTAHAVFIEDIQDVSALPFTPAVLKPVAGVGTTHTTLVNSIEDLPTRRGGPRAFLLEEFVSGDEWVADGVMFDGELQFLALGTYGRPCLKVVSQDLPLWMRRFDPAFEAWAYQLAEPVVRRAIAALGLRDGVFHMELFHQEGKLVFGECAARRGGALTQEEIQTKFNVDLGECAVLCALGIRPEPVIKVRPGYVGGTNLLGTPGTLISCPTPADLMALPNVEFARIGRPFGSRIVTGVHSTAQRLGQVLVTAPTETDLAQRMTETRSWFAARLVVAPADATTRELRAWQRRHWPDLDFGEVLWA